MKKKFGLFKSNLQISTVVSLLILYIIGWNLLIPLFSFEIIEIISKSFEMDDNLVNILFNLMCFSITGVLAVLIIIKDKISFFKIKLKEVDWTFIVVMALIYMLWNITTSLIYSVVIPSDITNSTNENALIEIQKSYPVLLFVLTVVLAPIVEELIYRVGISGLISKWSVPAAIVISSFIFGFVHIQSAIFKGDYHEWWYMLSYMGSGIIFGVAYHMKNHVFYPWALHFWNNALSTLLVVWVIK